MERQKVESFKNHQRMLAREISKVHGGSKYTIDFESVVRDLHQDRKTGKLYVANKGQMIMDTSMIRYGRNRVIVIMRFENSYIDANKIGKVLKRQFDVRETDKGFEVRTSYAINTIARL